MKYYEFLKTIESSAPCEWTYDDNLGIYVYKENISITIQSDRSTESDYDDNRFYETWAESYPDNKAYKTKLFLKYNGVTIETFYMVAVDGYRALIPYTCGRNILTITHFQYSVAKIINKPYIQFEDKLREGKIIPITQTLIVKKNNEDLFQIMSIKTKNGDDLTTYIDEQLPFDGEQQLKEYLASKFRVDLDLDDILIEFV